jgi:hypothetical protein
MFPKLIYVFLTHLFPFFFCYEPIGLLIPIIMTFWIRWILSRPQPPIDADVNFSIKLHQ